MYDTVRPNIAINRGCSIWNFAFGHHIGYRPLIKLGKKFIKIIFCLENIAFCKLRFPFIVNSLFLRRMYIFEIGENCSARYREFPRGLSWFIDRNVFMEIETFEFHDINKIAQYFWLKAYIKTNALVTAHHES